MRHDFIIRILHEDISVEVGREEDPQHVGCKKPRRRRSPVPHPADVDDHQRIKQEDVDESRQRAAQVKEEDAPQKIDGQLQEPQRDVAFVAVSEHAPQRKAHAEVDDSPCDRKGDVGRRQRGFRQQGIPYGDGLRLKTPRHETRDQTQQDGDDVISNLFHRANVALQPNDRANFRRNALPS